MENPDIKSTLNNDSGAADRKKDHIDLAFRSNSKSILLDERFDYEPMLAPFPTMDSMQSIDFLGKTFKFPIWVSSMTGGTQKARNININLAKACGEFGLGMGLGSCRQLLYSDEYLHDFDVRKYMGEQPLYINLGVAQVEELISRNDLKTITTLIHKLSADGLIIHVNPMQEWLQPEGDKFCFSPLATITKVIDANIASSIIVKEVGQGMGPKSLDALLRLPIEAIEFAAFGGTNFALLEILRSDESIQENYQNIAEIGHTATQMVASINQLLFKNSNQYLCKQAIISGGITDFLDGYHAMSTLQMPAIYGQASAMLKQAMGDYEQLHNYVSMQVEGLKFAQAYLSPKSDSSI